MADNDGSMPTPPVRETPSESTHASQPAPMSNAKHGLDRLIAYALPAMESLHQQLASPTLTVLLADKLGCILSMVGAKPDWIDPSPRLSAPRDSAAASPGNDAGPTSHVPLSVGSLPMTETGTIHGGTVPGDRAVLGVAAPILVAGGGILGIIDFAAMPDDSFAHANALLQTTAAIIEHRLVESDERGFLMLRFHPNVGVLGSPLEGVALFDRESLLLAKNRVASTLLALDHQDAELHYADCFETRWSGLIGHAASRVPDAFVLRAGRGAQFFARASLR